MSDLTSTPPQDEDDLETAKPAEELVVEVNLGTPWITYAVIAVCVLIFAYLNLFDESAAFPAVIEALGPSAIRTRRLYLPGTTTNRPRP